MGRIEHLHPAIEISGLTRYFGKVHAVDGIDLTIEKGGVYGILGPNGAGKTTLIRMLATLLHPSSGTARVLGHDIVSEAKAIRKLVSLTGQFASVDEDLTGLENLILLGRLFGYSFSQAKSRARELLDGFGLMDAAKRQVKTYSGGMRRRLDIAASLVVRPELIFLDEPTTGLDPRSRNQVWDIVRELVADGTTVLLTTQYLDEADQLARRIAVIDHGKVIAKGTPTELKHSVGTRVLRVHLRDEKQKAGAKDVISLIVNSEISDDTDPFQISLQVESTMQASHIISALSNAGLDVAGFSLGQPSLDEVFLALTGEPAGKEKDS
ncbi:ATP-binding cassette domain-containing protein [Anaerophaga thermohalophila]|jgi:ABC-2 type transport system ATP-binding protein|uniref:ATP-binding cassette domain-containing protein n=1 Tax=Anaerophaga thermohalophila TaxID=177400 RepID=UPI00031F63C5|nr:ATP-binding cassette domain-containing protein [Anaerophaga thermohalophila]